MALWALAMFWATAASVFVTGVGIFFVWRTLNANTEAVAAARENNDIARAQTMAFVSITEPRFFQRDDRYVLSVLLVNQGNSIARKCRLGAYYRIDTGPSTLETFSTVDIKANDESRREIDLWRESENGWLPKINSKGIISEVVVVTVWYTDIFGREHSEPFALSVRINIREMSGHASVRNSSVESSRSRIARKQA